MKRNLTIGSLLVALSIALFASCGTSKGDESSSEVNAIMSHWVYRCTQFYDMGPITGDMYYTYAWSYTGKATPAEKAKYPLYQKYICKGWHWDSTICDRVIDAETGAEVSCNEKSWRPLAEAHALTE
jgi:hypothetical protein